MFPKKENNKLVTSIMNQCVTISDDEIDNGKNINDIMNWCKEKFGDMRPMHPIYEAYEGYMDFFEEGWAAESTMLGVSFWFANTYDRTLFKLTWL